MAQARLPEVNARIKRVISPQVELVRGDGYHYFVFDDGVQFETESVAVCHTATCPPNAGWHSPKRSSPSSSEEGPMAKFIYKVLVEGIGSFPDDMLRYDRGEFATKDDQKIAEGRGQRKLWIVCQDRPTVARWESFMWRVVTESRERV